MESVDLSKRPFTLTVNGETIKAKTIIITSGAGHKHLGLENEHLLEKKGVTYCATCDGACCGSCNVARTSGAGFCHRSSAT